MKIAQVKKWYIKYWKLVDDYKFDAQEMKEIRILVKFYEDLEFHDIVNKKI